ncbi:sulfatase [Nocardioides sp. AE5]|uniref:sulfatase n=1 Tax=Nocardioides sp. AE5 TaxID=2962573 RepID=UPI002881E0DA|nr:sulfatase [Nocardioides sp. AE5]MDT0203163.1 sulfatase [Nocardioides sp. AE5]
MLLLDSLNRHMLGGYGSQEFETPNLDRVAARSLRFDNHYAGSLPCMPARHDILCGALDFLWRPWGSVEAWEATLPSLLRDSGVVSALVTDHPHLFETGGENYHTGFTAWDFARGSEDDPWQTRRDPSAHGTPAGLPTIRESPLHAAYDRSRSYFRSEADFPGPRTMSAAADWLEANADEHDRFFLFIDEFDPHEPFDTPVEWASKYDDTWHGPRLVWPPYVRGGLRQGRLSEREGWQLRANYGAKLSMIDHWLGRILDVFDRNDLWQNTALFVCTDHGHYLGEHDNWGKPASPIYQEMGQLPLFVAWPGRPAGSTRALSTSVDLFATLAEIFAVTPKHRTHGRSLVPLIEGRASEVREHLLSGVWGREVHVVGDGVKYAHAPAEQNGPLAMWSNRWSTIPLHAYPAGTLAPLDARARLDFMPGSSVPVIRQPFVPGDMLPIWAQAPFEGNVLFDLHNDPGESENRAGSRLERDAEDMLVAALDEVEAPAEQYQRLGLR